MKVANVKTNPREFTVSRFEGVLNTRPVNSSWLKRLFGKQKYVHRVSVITMKGSWLKLNDIVMDDNGTVFVVKFFHVLNPVYQKVHLVNTTPCYDLKLSKYFKECFSLSTDLDSRRNQKK